MACFFNISPQIKEKKGLELFPNITFTFCSCSLELEGVDVSKEDHP